MILPKVRDPRFITIRRGGTLTDAEHKLLAVWAADCAEHVLPWFEAVRPEDGRPRRALALEGEGERAGRRECRWQRAQLPRQIRALVLDDQRRRNEICWQAFVPERPGRPRRGGNSAPLAHN